MRFYQLPMVTLFLPCFFGGLVVFTIFTSVASAQFNPQVNYQGKLATPAGVAVPDGTYQMVLRLYTVASGGSAIWTETLSGANEVVVTNGLFSVMLGSTTALTGVNFNQPLYLGVTIEADAEMTPRKILGTVPSAFEAKNAETVGGVASTSFLRNDRPGTLSSTSASTLLTITQSGTGDILNLFDGGTEVFTVLDGGNVGIGSTTPSTRLTVAGAGFFGGNLTATGTLAILGTSTLATTTISSSTITSLQLLNALSATSGGTGLNTYATGDFIFASGADTLARRAIGSTGNIISVVGGVPTWVATSTLNIAIADTTGTLAATRGGTGLSTITQNQLLIGGAGNTWLQMATSSLSAGLLDNIDSTSFFRSDASDSYTSGTLTFDSATLLDLNTTGLSIADTSVIFDGVSTNFDLTGDFSLETDQFYLDRDTGNIGMGTNSPSSLLQIGTGIYFGEGGPGGTGSVGSDIRFSSAGLLSADSAFNINIDADNNTTNTFFSISNNSSSTLVATELFRVQEDGNVGIGSSTPSATLTVVGSSNVSGVATFGSAVNLTGGALQIGSTDVIDSSRRFFAASGSLGTGTLAYSFSSDTNTGLYNIAADSIGFATAGVASVGITSSGLGIGTTNPDDDLHIARLGDATIIVDADADNVDEGDNPTIHLRQDNTAVNALFAINGSDGVRYSDSLANATYLESSIVGGGGALQFVTGGTSVGGEDGTARMTILDTGNIGMGTNSPSSLLQIGTGIYFGEGGPGGTGSVGSDIRFSSAGLLSADSAFNINIDADNNTTNTFFSISNNSSSTLVATELFRVQEDGNVGIGTELPENDLHVSREGDATIIVEADSENIGEGDNPTVLLRQDGNTSSALFAINGSAGVRYSGSLANATYVESKNSGGSGDLQFVTGGSTIGGTDGTARMTILSAGNVGIGTDAPSAKLSVVGNGSFSEYLSVGSGATAITALSTGDLLAGTANFGFQYDASNNDILFQHSEASTISSTLFARKSRGTISSPTAIVSGDDTMLITAQAYVGATNGYIASSRIYMDTEGTITDAGSGAAPGLIRFQTADSAGTLTTRMFIDSTGSVGIGDNTPTEATLVLGSAGTGNIFLTLDTGGTTNNAVCWDNTGATLLYDCDATPADYAESYPTTADVTYAEIVMTTDEQVTQTDGDKSPKLTKAVRGVGAVIGITSNNYHDFTSAAKGIIPDIHHPLPVALNGRVPVKVNLEGGVIKQGDNIALSSVPGVGKKATDSGETVVGIALADYTSTTASGTVLVFVSNKTHQTIGDLARAGLLSVDLNASSTVLNTLLEDTTDTIWNRLVNLAARFSDNILTLVGLKAGTIETETLCIGNTCVTETMLIELLNQSNSGSNNPGPAPVPPPEVPPPTEGGAGEVPPEESEGGSAPADPPLVDEPPPSGTEG